MNSREKLLTLLLRVSAAVLLLAVVPAFMPFEWMVKAHRTLGLGELSETPLNHYLTRSLSAVYVFHGGLLLIVSFDLQRSLALIRFLGFGDMLLGGFLLWLDIHAGMPTWWRIVEGPSVMATGLLIVVLAQGVRRGEPH